MCFSQPVVIVFSFSERDVTNGTFTMSVNCGVLHCYTNSFGLCDDVKRKCPIKAGHGSLVFDNPIGNYKYVSNVNYNCTMVVNPDQSYCFIEGVQITYTPTGR